MFWNKKKKFPPIPQITERELEIVNYVIQAMEKHPNHWNVRKDSIGRSQLDYPEVEDGRTVNLVTYLVAAHSPKLLLNSAEIALTDVSKDRLNRAGQELMQEKLIRAISNTEKTLAQ